MTKRQGAKSIAQLSTGGSSGQYELIVSGWVAAKATELAAGGTFEPMNLLQGEQDQINGTSISTYVTHALHYRLSFTNDMWLPSGITGLMPMVRSQTSAWASQQRGAYRARPAKART